MKTPTKKFKQILAIAIATASVAVSNNAIASRYEVPVARHFVLEKHWFGSSKSIQLQPNTFVGYVEIKARGLKQDSTVELKVNGHYKGEVQAPVYGGVSHLIVNETASSLEVQIEKGDDVEIVELSIENSFVESNNHHERRESPVQEFLEHKRPMPHYDDDMNDSFLDQDDFYMQPGFGGNVAGLAAQTQRVVVQMKKMANFSELSTYIGPVQKAAAVLTSVAQTHYPSEEVTRQSIQNLSQAIADAAPFINEQLESDIGQRLASQLITIKAKLDKMLN